MDRDSGNICEKIRGEVRVCPSVKIEAFRRRESRGKIALRFDAFT